MKSLIRTLCLSLLLLLPTLSYGTALAAVDIIPGCTSGQIPSNSAACTDVKNVSSGTSDPVVSFIKVAITIISYITGVAAVALIVVSGIKFMTSSGNPEKVSSAKGTLIYALIGILITVIGQTIVAFVLDKVSIK